MLFILSRILEAVAYYEGRVASHLIDPVSLGVRKLKLLLDKRGVSYAGVVEKPEMTELVEASGTSLVCNIKQNCTRLDIFPSYSQSRGRVTIIVIPLH